MYKKSPRPTLARYICTCTVPRNTYAKPSGSLSSSTKNLKRRPNGMHPSKSPPVHRPDTTPSYRTPKSLRYCTNLKSRSGGGSLRFPSGSPCNVPASFAQEGMPANQVVVRSQVVTISASACNQKRDTKVSKKTRKLRPNVRNANTAKKVNTRMST